MISQALVEVLRGEFQLDWDGIHGAPHWARVRNNGLQLAESTGAIRPVVELFAFLHDARRAHDGHDRHHGERAAELARELQGHLFDLPSRELVLLETACREHSNGGTRGDPTVLTCWDADRLDLGRVGIRPDPANLCTKEARRADTIAAAFERSVRERGY